MTPVELTDTPPSYDGISWQVIVSPREPARWWHRKKWQWKVDLYGRQANPFWEPDSGYARTEYGAICAANDVIESYEVMRDNRRILYAPMTRDTEVPSKTCEVCGTKESV